MSKQSQYNFYYTRNATQKVQPINNQNIINSIQQLHQIVRSQKAQLQQKQSKINQLSQKILELQTCLEQKQFLIQEKQLELQYIHKQNQQLHEKLFKLNQKLNQQRAQIKDTIKQQVGMLREEFNFMIKENQTKNQIILQQKEKEFRKKEQELNAVIKDLSQRASSVNSSFFYDEQSNLSKPKLIPSSLSKRNENYLQKEEEKNSTANSNLKNSRQSYKSNQIENRLLTSLKDSQVDGGSSRSITEKQNGMYSFSNISFTQPRETGSFEINSQTGTGKFGFAHKQPSMIKQNLRRSGQSKPELTKTNSKANIQEIINRSKRELYERNQKNSQTNLTKISSKPALMSFGRNPRLNETLNISRDSYRYRSQYPEQSSKFQKMREISSLKMKVNMLKSQLQQQITFCKHKE